MEGERSVVKKKKKQEIDTTTDEFHWVQGIFWQ